MLTIIVSEVPVFDDDAQEFKTQGGVEVELEHSLVSLSKWESKFEKPFLSSEDKSHEEIVEYVRCMALDPKTPPELFLTLSEANFEDINSYLEAKQTATWFSDAPGAPKARQQIITSELIYFWMISFEIPFSCETWHLNRLFTLIRIANAKTATPEKMTRSQIAERNRELNAQRRAQLKTTG